MAKRKRTNNGLQNIAQKIKDRATRTPLKSGGELVCCGRLGISCSTCGIHRVTLHRNDNNEVAMLISTFFNANLIAVCLLSIGNISFIFRATTSSTINAKFTKLRKEWGHEGGITLDGHW
jgi:hypothetical protein